MERIYEFDPVIYPRLLWIVVNPTKEVLQEFYSDLNEDSIKGKAVVCVASKKSDNSAGYLVVFNSKKNMDVETIAHEAIHVGLDLFHELDIEYDGQHQEALAYFVGWVAKCCEQVKNNKV